MASTTIPQKRGKLPMRERLGPYHAQAQSLLFTLPPEIRNTIYRYALDVDVNYMIRKTRNTPRLHLVRPTPPGLLLTCRHVYKEASLMYYATATFCFETSTQLRTWTKKIGRGRVKLLARVCVESPAPNVWMTINSSVRPKSALREFAMAAESNLVEARKILKGEAVEVCTDLYLPREGKVWTKCTTETVEKFVMTATQSELDLVWRSFLRLEQDRAVIWV